MSSLTAQIANADSLEQSEFLALLETLSEQYYNETPTVSDATFDTLQELYERRFGKYDKIRAPPCIGLQNKKTLPKYMGSLDKVKTKAALDLWKAKNPGPYVVSDKLDGISLLIHDKDLYTGGNGIVGTDVSHLLPYLQDIPKSVNNDVFVRAEVVMPISTFKAKYQTTMANTRNMVIGLIGCKTVDLNAARDLKVIAYEYDNGNALPQSEQIEKLDELGFVIPYAVVADDVDIEFLTELLTERKRDADYDIDGLVVVSDHGMTPVPGQNPKNAIAFKMEGASVETEVLGVEWNVSKHGLLKPRVNFEPVSLCGVTIEWATGFNARFILENKVGPGAVVEITRSGDVIPFIKDVPVPAAEAQMPEIEYRWARKKQMAKVAAGSPVVGEADRVIEDYGNESYYVWYEESDVDIEVTEESDEMEIQKLVSFFKKLDAKFVGEATLRKIYEGGYQTLGQIFSLTVEDLIAIGGFQQKGAERIVAAIRAAITNVPLARLAAASGVMGVGIGEKKIQLVVDAYPDILEMDLPLSELTTLIQGIGGFQKMAVHFAEKLQALKSFLREHPEITIRAPAVQTAQTGTTEESRPFRANKESLAGRNVVFTGFRDKALEDLVTSEGGKVTTSVSGKTNMLVVKERGAGKSKEVKAQQQGIEIVTAEEFRRRFG